MNRTKSLRATLKKTSIRTWDDTQKKTSQGWVNSVLGGKGIVVKDLFTDLQNGETLIHLANELTGRKCEVPQFKFALTRPHMIDNCNRALTLLANDIPHIRRHCGAEDIVDGNKKAILSMLWVLIQHYHLTANLIENAGSRKGSSAAEAPTLLMAEMHMNELMKEVRSHMVKWCNEMLESYNITVTNDFTQSFEDGKAFCALLHRLNPKLIDYKEIIKLAPVNIMGEVFSISKEKLGIMDILDPVDLVANRYDDQSIITYLTFFVRVFNDGMRMPGMVMPRSTEDLKNTIRKAGLQHASPKHGRHAHPKQATAEKEKKQMSVETKGRSPSPVSSRVKFFDGEFGGKKDSPKDKGEAKKKEEEQKEKKKEEKKLEEERKEKERVEEKKEEEERKKREQDEERRLKEQKKGEEEAEREEERKKQAEELAQAEEKKREEALRADKEKKAASDQPAEEKEREKKDAADKKDEKLKTKEEKRKKSKSPRKEGKEGKEGKEKTPKTPRTPSSRSLKTPRGDKKAKKGEGKSESSKSKSRGEHRHKSHKESKSSQGNVDVLELKEREIAALRTQIGSYQRLLSSPRAELLASPPQRLSPDEAIAKASEMFRVLERVAARLDADAQTSLVEERMENQAAALLTRPKDDDESQPTTARAAVASAGSGGSPPPAAAAAAASTTPGAQRRIMFEGATPREEAAERDAECEDPEEREAKDREMVKTRESNSKGSLRRRTSRRLHSSVSSDNNNKKIVRRKSTSFYKKIAQRANAGDKPMTVEEATEVIGSVALMLAAKYHFVGLRVQRLFSAQSNVLEGPILKAQACARRWLGMKNYGMLKQRRSLSTSLMENEKSFVQMLRTFVSEVVHPMRVGLGVSRENAKTLFSDIETLLNYNTMLTLDLSSHVTSFKHDTSVAEVFWSLLKTDYVKLYRHYLSNLVAAAEVLSILRSSNPDFKSFLDSWALKSQSFSLLERSNEGSALLNIFRGKSDCLQMMMMVSTSTTNTASKLSPPLTRGRGDSVPVQVQQDIVSTRQDHARRDSIMLDPATLDPTSMLMVMLLAPVQRFSSYANFIDRYSSNCWVGSDEAGMANSVALVLKEVAEESVAAADSAMNAHNILLKQELIDGLPRSLVVEGRYFMYQGPLVDVQGRSKHKYYVLLFSNLLLLTRKKKKKNKVLQFSREIILTSTTVVTEAHLDNAKFCFQVVNPSDLSMLVLCAEGNEEKNIWMKLMNNAIDQIKLKERLKRRSNKKKTTSLRGSMSRRTKTRTPLKSVK